MIGGKRFNRRLKIVSVQTDYNIIYEETQITRSTTEKVRMPRVCEFIVRGQGHPVRVKHEAQMHHGQNWGEA